MHDHRDLPGGDLYDAGVADLCVGRLSLEALLVAGARRRLEAAGLHVPPYDLERPAHVLYDSLAAEDPENAHGRYNGLRRRIASFAHAVEHAAAH